VQWIRSHFKIHCFKSKGQVLNGYDFVVPSSDKATTDQEEVTVQNFKAVTIESGGKPIDFFDS